MSEVLIAGSRCSSDENELIEFKMHLKNSLNEVPRRRDGNVVVRHMQPLSQTICAFLNTDGGRIYIGVEDSGIVRGIPLTHSMKEHYLASLSECLYLFDPKVPPELIQVAFLTVKDPNDPDKRPIPQFSSYTDEENGVIARGQEPLFHTSRRTSTLMTQIPNYLFFSANSITSLVHKSAFVLPNREKGVLYRNDEGLVYFRRHGSNKMMPLSDLLAHYSTPYLRR
ncbi:unnamed protein product [Nippostrongylus brasiliensis]|uniref:AlbA_2 domain-containing protein n=1 Tax=Nippostrongylus brasiliensis TaxID=27835 RepID=A0A158R1Z3_NIPBR|nr:unnamed protein product [Nippostrongylus brasiliensis]